MSKRYWNKNLKCWWNYPYVRQIDGKIYSCFWWNGEKWGIDISEYVEVIND